MHARLNPSLMLATLLAGLAITAHSAMASGIVGNVGVGFGGQWISQPSYWYRTPDDGRREATVNIMLGHRALPIALDAYVARTHGKVNTPIEYRYDETTYEVGLGAVRVWNIGRAHPYGGGGIASITSRARRTDPADGTKFDNTYRGPWIGAGAFVSVAAGLNVGVAGRYTKVDPEHQDNLGGWSAGAFIGWGWPGSK